MTLPSPELPSNRLRPGQVSGPRHVLTDSAPALPEAATRLLVQMPPTAASRDLAYTGLWRCQPADVGCIRRRRIVAHSRGRSRGADRRRRGGGRHAYRALLANPRRTPSDAAPDDSATAAVIEMLFRQGLLQQPISIDDPAEAPRGCRGQTRDTRGADWVRLGSRCGWCGMPGARRPCRRMRTSPRHSPPRQSGLQSR